MPFVSVSELEKIKRGAEGWAYKLGRDDERRDTVADAIKLASAEAEAYDRGRKDALEEEKKLDAEGAKKFASGGFTNGTVRLTAAEWDYLNRLNSAPAAPFANGADADRRFDALQKFVETIGYNLESVMRIEIDDRYITVTQKQDDGSKVVCEHNFSKRAAARRKANPNAHLEDDGEMGK